MDELRDAILGASGPEDGLTGRQLVQEEAEKLGVALPDLVADSLLWEHTGFPSFFDNPPGAEATFRQQVRDEVPAGTTVLVTMVSRLGDVGIRDDRLVPGSNGYYTRVKPKMLTNWRPQP